MNVLRILALFFALFLSGYAYCDDAQWLSDFASDTKSRAEQRNLPGYIFAFIEKGKPAKVVAFGKTEKSGDKIDEDTVFRLASVSKTFAGVLMAQVVSQNKLSWQTPILELAPKYGFNRLDPNPINIGHLMSQSSGYMPNAYDNLIEANYTLDRVLKHLAKLKPVCSPGKCYTYQNALFGVLEYYYLQQQTSYGEVLRKQIIEPLKMPHASTGKEALEKSSKWAKPHIAIARDKWRQTRVQGDYYRYAPAAGVNASIADMSIWIRAMLGEYPNIITKEMVETVTTPRTKTKREMRRRDWRKFIKDAHYGYGWRVYDFNGHKLNYHGGWVQGYRADVSFAPEKGVGYIMLMNAESNLINSYTAKLWEAYFKHNP